MDTFIYYFAGLFDGEGWITISRRDISKTNKRKKYTLEVGVNLCDSDPLATACERWGGYFFDCKPGKESWRPCRRWLLQATKAEAFLRDIGPYLIIKRNRYELAMRFQNHIHESNHLRYGGKHTTILPDDVYAERDAMFLEMRHLNFRGVAGKALTPRD